jgi:ATP-binding cassette subfamily B protein
MIKQTKALWGYFSSDRKHQFYALFFLMVLASVSEVISLGSILPFLGALLSPDTLLRFPVINRLGELISLSSQNELVVLAAIVFIIAAIVAGLLRLLLLYFINIYSFAVGADLSVEIYRRTLFQPYFKHALINTSDLISSVTSRTNTVIFNVVLNSQILLSSFVLLFIISTALMIIEPIISAASFLIFASIYIGIAWFTKKFIYLDGEVISRESAKSLQALQEGLGGIRDVILDGTQNYFCDIYKKSDIALRRSQARVQFIYGSPRFIVEALGMVFIAVLIVILTKRNGGVALAIPLLGVMVMGAQRMLPLLQQIYSSFSGIRAGQASLKEILKLLGEESEGVNHANDVLDFNLALDVSNVKFYYGGPTPKLVLSGVDMKIPKGARVGIIGKTGSGKSTLANLLMGLLTPSSGKITVDNVELNVANIRSWQNIVAHVPQNIYLSDNTIEENIAFGIPAEKINRDLVREVAKQAQLEDLIQSWPEGYLTSVGENGARLSGGQRQRIAIARALYKRAKVIIFDEATSALDIKTEKAVIRSIYEIDSNITVIIIAHRTSTLVGCDFIYEIEDKKLITRRLSQHQK